MFNVKGNEVDCDVFAIAFNVELAFGESPEKKLFDPNSMRRHLFKCLKKGGVFFVPNKKKIKEIK